MAIEVTSLTITPEVFTLDDTVTAQISFKNTGSSTIKSVGFGLRFRYGSTNYAFSFTQSASVNVAKNATAVVTLAQRVSGGAAVNLNRILALTRGVVFDTALVTTNDEEGTYVTLGSKNYIRAVNKRCNPIIEKWDAVRCDNEGNEDDEGLYALCSLKLNANYSADYLLANDFELKITSAGLPSSFITPRIRNAFNGIERDNTLFQSVVPNSENHTLTIRFGDDYEWAELSVDLPRSFANVHMSGAANGGVCFGGFSSSTDDDPKLESYYPAHLYGGIEQLNVQNKWVATPTYASGFKAYEGFEPRVTRVGCFVFLDGMITPTASKSTSAAEGVLMATLPAWACPRVRVNLLMQGSTAAVWWMMITPESDGTCTVRIARYRQTNSTSYASVASGNQLPVTAMWIAADAYPAEEETNALADAD